MKNSNKEPMKLTKSRIREPEAGAAGCEAGGSGQRRVGTWVRPGLSGQEVGKRPGFAHIARTFSHLGPDNSTQVVDFPRICTVRLFWGPREMLATDGTPIKHGCRKDGSIRKAGTEENRNGKRRVNHGWATMDTDMTKK